MRESRNQRCPECGFTFKVLADEWGLHDCPSCGYSPADDGPTDEEIHTEEQHEAEKVDPDDYPGNERELAEEKAEHDAERDAALAEMEPME